MSLDTAAGQPPSALASDGPTDRLAALYQAGRLASQYPEVRRLLAGLSEEELIRAGHLLARVAPDEVLRENPTVPSLSVAITGHGTVSALVSPLTAELARHGLLLRPFVANFDSYVFDLGDPDSALYAAAPELVLCVLDPNMVFDEVPVPWQSADVARAAEEWLRRLTRLAERFAATSKATLVLNTIPLPHRFAAQLVDHRARAELGVRWREVNAALLQLAAEQPAVVVLDLEPLIAEGIVASDVRMDTYAKAHLSAGLLARYAREVAHLAAHLTGRTRKCLVLDLDNTVWGGVVGEDGMDGIEVADSYRGEAFRAFQRVVKQLGSQGVLLAAVSKNDPEPVRVALREHPRMTLREDDFVRVVANWRPKHDNLTELAQALNLGVDSFVFVDDSAYECGLIQHALPDVAVVQLDDEPALHVQKLLRDGWFNVRELTSADRARIATYRDELVRKDFLEKFDSIEDYLGALDIRVRLATVAEPDVARVSQITLRTNQFNLTTRRMQPADVRDLVADPDWLVLAIHSADRFGEHGLVGAVLARRDGNALFIDNFMLSCRVFGRGIEQSCLASVLRHARDTGAAAVFARYRPTAKNGIVRDLYPRYGFTPVPGTGDPDTSAEMTFRHDLTDISEPPYYVRLIESFREDSQ